MRVADEDMADRPSRDHIDQGLQMRLVVRSRIDHRKRIAANNVAVGAVKGEGARIAGRDALDIERDTHPPAIEGVEAGIEFECHGGCIGALFQETAKPIAA